MGKPKKNGFVLYAESRRPEFRRAGYTLEGGIRDLVNLCAKDWEQLSEDEKQKWKDVAKQFNEQAKWKADQEKRLPPQPQQQAPPSASSGGMTVCDPNVFSPEDERMMEENREIVNGIFQLAEGWMEWIKQPVVICSFTSYVDPGILPAEIGLTAMTVKNGVVDNFARIIDPTPVPRGDGVEAVQTARKLGLPEFGTAPEFASLEPLMMILGDFLHRHKGKLPGQDLYVFAFDSDYLTVKRCLSWLFEKTNYQLPIKILSLDQFGYLASLHSNRRNANTESMFLLAGNVGRVASSSFVSSYRKPEKSLCGGFMYSTKCPTSTVGVFMTESDVAKCVKDEDNYKYYEEICCIYHTKNGKEIHNCALNMSNRYAFSLLEILTLTCDVPIIPGGHHPQVDKPEVEKRTRYRMLAKWGITDFEEQMKVETNHDEDQEGPSPAELDRESEREKIRWRAREERRRGEMGGYQEYRQPHPRVPRPRVNESSQREGSLSSVFADGDKGAVGDARPYQRDNDNPRRLEGLHDANKKIEKVAVRQDRSSIGQLHQEEGSQVKPRGKTDKTNQQEGQVGVKVRASRQPTEQTPPRPAYDVRGANGETIGVVRTYGPKSGGDRNPFVGNVPIVFGAPGPYDQLFL